MWSTQGNIKNYLKLFSKPLFITLTFFLYNNRLVTWQETVEAQNAILDVISVMRDAGDDDRSRVHLRAFK